MTYELQTHTEVEWLIERHGEIILWGRGTLHIDAPDFSEEGYKVQATPDEYISTPRVWLLTAPEGYPDPGPDDYRGFAFGELNRKMVPEVTPDITAVEMHPAEGFNYRLAQPPGGEDDG